MRRGRRLLLVAACSVPLSQLGHALASSLRGGGLVERDPAHAYFAVDLTASAGFLAAAGGVAAVTLAAARVLRGTPPARSRRATWPLTWTLLALAALQLELFLVQELAEGSTTIDVAWRGLLGQLPVAALAAVVIHWLSERLGPAARELRRRLPGLLDRLAPAPARRPAALVSRLSPHLPPSSDPRGPPLLLRLALAR